MTIAVLLSTYNGASFLDQQLKSLLSQDDSSFEIFARDDGSQDNTIKILQDYDLQLLTATENLGPKDSFGALLKFAVTNTEAQYFMFCDQDDVWFSDKVRKTLAKMRQMETAYGNIPLLVHTDLELVDANLNKIAPSMWIYEHILPKKNSFHFLLVQNCITGCTVMINRELAKKCLNIPNDAIMHDWWLGLVASQFGRIDFISEPTIKYRQHGKNTIGANRFKVNVLGFITGLISSILLQRHDYLGEIKSNIDQAEAFLSAHGEQLNGDQKGLLSDFISLPSKNWIIRRFILFRRGLWSHGFLRNISKFIRL